MDKEGFVNTLIQKELYNKGLKEKFLDRYVGSTRDNFTRVLYFAYVYELRKNRDISQFNENELFEFFKGFKLKSIAGIHTLVSQIRQYILYIVDNDLLEASIEDIDTFRGKDKLSELLYAVAVETSYISREDLLDLLDFCANAQDAALIGLIFEGAKPFEELINLKKTDINFTSGEVLLTKNDGKERILRIKDDAVLSCIKDAIHQEVYLKNNGDNCDLRTPAFNLVNSDYIFRVAGKATTDKVTERTLRERITKITTLYGRKYLNPKNIWISGMIDFGKSIRTEFSNKELDKEDYLQINNRFGYDPQYWYNTKRMIEKHL